MSLRILFGLVVFIVIQNVSDGVAFKGCETGILSLDATLRAEIVLKIKVMIEVMIKSIDKGCASVLDLCSPYDLINFHQKTRKCVLDTYLNCGLNIFANLNLTVEFNALSTCVTQHKKIPGVKCEEKDQEAFLEGLLNILLHDSLDPIFKLLASLLVSVLAALDCLLHAIVDIIASIIYGLLGYNLKFLLDCVVDAIVKLLSGLIDELIVNLGICYDKHYKASGMPAALTCTMEPSCSADVIDSCNKMQSAMLNILVKIEAEIAVFLDCILGITAKVELFGTYNDVKCLC